MKFNDNSLRRYLDNPEPAIRAILVFGADEGLVRERAAAIAAVIVEDLADPFRVSNLDAPEVVADPASLADEAAALSMTGGRRLIRVHQVGERTRPAFEAFFQSPPSDSLVVAVAGDLAPKSKLRGMFENARDAAAIACFSDNAESLDRLVETALGGYGLTVSADAKSWLIQHLGSDRMVSRQELEKLATYMGASGGPDGAQSSVGGPTAGTPDGTVELEDAVACIGDSSAQMFDQAGAAAMRGDTQAMLGALTRALESGNSAVGILRLIARRLLRLHFVASTIQAGGRQDAAFKGLKPPAFSREAAELAALVPLWSPGRLIGAIELINEAEAQCKTTGMPAEAVCTRAMMRLAHAASQARGTRKVSTG